jgi:site-specific DNA-methyltransferase (adenine-specific)
LNQIDKIGDSITLYRGDCLEVMKEIPDGSVGMILCDLPYGTTKCKWDIIIPFDNLWPHYERVVKTNGAIVLFGTEPFTSEMIMSNLPLYRQKLTWLKTRPTNVFNAKKQFMNWTEDIVVFYKSLPTFNPIMRTDGQFSGAKVQRMNTDRSQGHMVQTGEKKDYVHQSNGGLFYPKTILEFSNVNQHKNVHPTQKPTELLEYLIKTYTNDGNVVLDNAMGGGSTGVACINTKRKFIGIELDKNYYDIAKGRLEDALR